MCRVATPAEVLAVVLADCGIGGEGEEVSMEDMGHAIAAVHIGRAGRATVDELTEWREDGAI